MNGFVKFVYPIQWVRIVSLFSSTSFCIHTKRISYSLCSWLVVSRIYVALAVFQPYRDLEAGDNQSLKFKWRGGGSNPKPLAPQAKSLTTRPPPLLASRFNLTYRYIDDVLSINNPEVENYLGQMDPAELEIKDTTESTTSASALLLSIGRDCQLHNSIYDKRDDFNFHITNFPFLSSNIPSSPAYGVFISQLIRYARACSSYECFILRAMRLSSKLLKQGSLVESLKSSFRKFYGRYGGLIQQYKVTLSRMLNDILTLDQQ